MVELVMTQLWEPCAKEAQVPSISHSGPLRSEDNPTTKERKIKKQSRGNNNKRTGLTDRTVVVMVVVSLCTLCTIAS